MGRGCVGGRGTGSKGEGYKLVQHGNRIKILSIAPIQKSLLSPRFSSVEILSPFP